MHGGNASQEELVRIFQDDTGFPFVRTSKRKKKGATFFASINICFYLDESFAWLSVCVIKRLVKNTSVARASDMMRC